MAHAEELVPLRLRLAHPAETRAPELVAEVLAGATSATSTAGSTTPTHGSGAYTNPFGTGVPHMLQTAADCGMIIEHFGHPPRGMYVCVRGRQVQMRAQTDNITVSPFSGRGTRRERARYRCVRTQTLESSVGTAK